MSTKLILFLHGFDMIYDSIISRLDCNDDIDRLIFFECLSCGWLRMYAPEDENIRLIFADYDGY
jgi:hypothetical protein